MKGWDKRRRQIKEELISRTGKRALLVEGPDDESLFRIFLSRKFGPESEYTGLLDTLKGGEFVGKNMESTGSYLYYSCCRDFIEICS